MGTSRSGRQLAGVMLRAANALEVGATAGVRAAAIVVTESVRRELANAGVDRRLSGVGYHGAAISVGFDIKGQGINPTALVRMRGPAQLIERDTAPHKIGVRTRAGKKAVVTPYGPRRTVQHPGTKGKHPFERGVDKARALTGTAFHGGVHAALRKVF